MNMANDSNSPVAWMAGHPVAANLLMVLCLVGGYLFLSQMKQEVFPEFDADRVQIDIAYPGASPKEVEQGIVFAVEQAIFGLDGIKEIKATANESIATITVEVLADADLKRVAQEIQKEIDRIRTFPVDTEKPQVTILSSKRRVVTVALYGDAEERSLHELAEQLRERLLSDSGITQVDLATVKPLEISIEIPQENLRRYQMTIDEVARRLQQASVDLPGGSIKSQNGEIMIRIKERRDFGEQFAKLPIITTAEGGEVLLQDIARINDSYAATDYQATYNGLPATLVDIYRVGNETPLQISQTVRRHLEQMSLSLPNGIFADILDDRSIVYQQRVDLLLRNSALGLILVMLFLALFLEVRLAFWVMMGIPISFLGAFLVLPSLGVSLNMISLFAFIVALGIVVDDAIIVGENIYHYRQQGMAPLPAAVRGAREMAMPVTFSILTNIATFMPLYFVPGIMGKIFQVIPIVVVTVFIISLLESLFVLPAHLARIKNRSHYGRGQWFHEQQQRFSKAFSCWVKYRFGKFLDFALYHRYFTIVIAFSILLLTLSYAMSGRMGMELFPETETDVAIAAVVLPYGTPLEKTETVVEKLLQSAAKVVAEQQRGDELVKGIFAEIGKNGSHRAMVKVYMADPDVRKHIISTREFTRRWRQLSGELPGVESLRFQSDFGGPGSGPAITIEASHRDMKVLEQVSSSIAAALNGYAVVEDVDDGFSPGKRQLDFTILPEGLTLGFTAMEVARQVRAAFYGAEVLRQQRGRNEVKVMVRLPEDERFSERDIYDFMLISKDGHAVPLHNVVKIERGHAYTVINRQNGHRVINITANVTPQSKAGEIVADLQETILMDLQHRYPGLQFYFGGKQAEMRDSLGSLKLSFVIAMLIVYAMLAIPFQSYIQPLIVMAAIPFGIIGAIYGHLIMGYDLSITSLLGVVALSGIVVNDSLVLINYANQQRLNGEKVVQKAVKAAVIQRFRAVLLTTLTTIGGLSPMILETSVQAKILIPMAISLGFGVLFATMITLILVPSLYMILDDVKSRLSRGKT